MQPNRRRALLLLLSLIATFAGLRSYLHLFPDTDLNVGPYNVHHLFTGLLLIMAGGIPLAVCQGHGKPLDLAAVVFGVGLSMALDEWVYLITTDGTNSSYLLPISFWGGVVMVALACLFVAALGFSTRSSKLTDRS